MKRTLCIVLIIIFALSLTSCGSEESTFDYLRIDSPVLIYTNRSQSQSIKGGAYLNMALNDLVGDERSGDESIVTMRSLFNEETKVIMPLCLNIACEHGNSNAECFGNIYGSEIRGCSGIYDDSVFYVREVPAERGQKSKNTLEIIYYGLDGTVQDKIEYTPELTLANGGVLDQSFFIRYGYLKYGTRLYFRISAYVSEADGTVFLEQSEIEYAHWFLYYDLETKKWGTVNKKAFQCYEQNIIPNDAIENMISFTYNGIGYAINIDNGDIEIYDCAEMLDRMISEGRLPVGTMLAGVYPLRDCFICFTETDRFYCSISASEFINPAESDQVYVEEYNKFVYNGDLYVFGSGSDTDLNLTNTNTGEQVTVGVDNKLMSLFSETENGLIFSYKERLEDGSWETDTHIVKENGKDVTYWYPQKYVYVTKEDILDGNIDEPWYYDVETYSFVQR